MQRSRSQVLYRYLPGAVFLHEDDLVVRTYRLLGTRLSTAVNREVLLAEVDVSMRQWADEQRAGIQLPSRVNPDEFLVLEPGQLDWEVWPLVFQCTNSMTCGRVRRFFELRNVREGLSRDGRLRCRTCGSRMRQMRYFNAHQCGRARELFVPECPSCHSRDHIRFEDTGSFATSAWRCRHCGDRYGRGMRFTPCTCHQYVPEGSTSNQAFMRAFTVRDSRTFFPQTVSLLNLKTRTYDHLQNHPRRDRVSIASYLGDEASVQLALDELELSQTSAGRMTREEWEEAVRTRYSALDQEEIDDKA